MSEPTSDSSADYVLLTKLADEFAARYRAGERPALQEYIDRYPQLADDIRELLPAMVEMEQVKEDHEEAALRLPVYMDVGEALSHMLSVIYGSGAIHRIPVTSTRGPGPIGTVFGDVAYHNFASTHGQGEHKRWAAEAWAGAVEQYLS